MRHLTPANCGEMARASGDDNAEYCFVDYSSCPQSDVCWLADMDNSCSSNDGCIIDVS